MILLFKPFKVGDYIEAQGFQGTVKEIQIFNTIIRTNDAQTIIIPNGGLSTGSLKNYSSEKYRRVDLDFHFAYGADLEAVKKAINKVQAASPLILQGPVDDSPVVAEPWVGITELAEKGVVVNTRTWCKGEDYWTVYFYMNSRTSHSCSHARKSTSTCSTSNARPTSIDEKEAKVLAIPGRGRTLASFVGCKEDDAYFTRSKFSVSFLSKICNLSPLSTYVIVSLPRYCVIMLFFIDPSI